MRWLLVVALTANGCAATEPRQTLENHGGRDYVELAWHARVDDRDWVHVTLVVDGTPFEVGMASGPDDEGSAPDGCTSAPDEANPAMYRFTCGLASRSYTAILEGGSVVVTRNDEWFEPHRMTAQIVQRVKVHGTKLHVLPYHAS